MSSSVLIALYEDKQLFILLTAVETIVAECAVYLARL